MSESLKDPMQDVGETLEERCRARAAIMSRRGEFLASRRLREAASALEARQEIIVELTEALTNLSHSATRASDAIRTIQDRLATALAEAKAEGRRHGLEEGKREGLLDAKLACLDLSDAYRETGEHHMGVGPQGPDPILTKAAEALAWARGATECTYAIGKLLAIDPAETQKPEETANANLTDGAS